MSEGYECDRCGNLKSGSPYASMQVDGGYPRTRPGRGKEYVHNTPIQAPAVIDLCESCVGGLAEWYADAGGERSEVLIEDSSDE
jgi:hypothetical protein